MGSVTPSDSEVVTMRMRTSLQALAGAALLLAACSDQNEPVAPTDHPEPSPAKTSAQGSPGDPNALARAVPGFGGAYLDAEGSPVVYLKDAAKHGEAVQALSPFLQARGIAPSRVKIRKGDFDWSALEGWKKKAVEALAVPGAVFVDADEASNRVRIGVEHGAAAGQVRSMLARLAVPESAVTVEQVEPVSFAIAPKPTGPTLQSRIRPIIGGVQINFPGFLCTLGFNARPEGTNDDSFITNSHCTNIQGGTEATPYWQPTATAEPVSIGTEVDDPTYFTGGNCPVTRRCRFSDASRARYRTGESFTHREIAKTNHLKRNSLQILGSYTVKQAAPPAVPPVVGDIVNKVGRTTGWSQGSVTGTCLDTSVSGSDITQLCQTWVSATVGAGDSGSPVYVEEAGDDIKLVGILWGGSGRRTFIFSPFSQIEQELGQLTVDQP